jgi:hypothetical protein
VGGRVVGGGGGVGGRACGPEPIGGGCDGECGRSGGGCDGEFGRGGGGCDGEFGRATDGIDRGPDCGTSPARRACSPASRASFAGASRRCAAGPGDSAASSERFFSSGSNAGADGIVTKSSAESKPRPGGGPGDASCAIEDGDGSVVAGAGTGDVVVGAGTGGAPTSVGAGAATGAGAARGAGGVPGNGGGIVVPVLRGAGAVARGGSCTPVGGALRARPGGRGGNRRPHA